MKTSSAGFGPILKNGRFRTKLARRRLEVAKEASHALRLCGAFLCRAQHTEPVTPYSRFVFGRDKGFHATPSGRGSLVYVGLVSRRGFRCPSYWRSSPGEKRMLSTILIIILILLLIGALPTWPYSSGWGYYPGGTLGLILIIVIILALIGRI